MQDAETPAPKRARFVPKGTAVARKRFVPRPKAPLKVDTGFVDLAQAAYGLDTTGAVTLLATIAQGASVNQRVGKRAQYKHLQFRGAVSSNTTTTLAEGTVIVVYDRRPTGSLPAVTDILVTANSGAFNNDANSGRFKIVRRWDYPFAGNAATPTTGREIYDFNEFVNLKGLNVVFKAAGTGAIADIEEGALYLVTVGNTAAGATAATLTTGARVRFVDT